MILDRLEKGPPGLIHELKVTTVVENTVRGPKLLGQHGLSFRIVADEHRILFDTGHGILSGREAQLRSPPEFM
jgi:hypothetical protein